MSKHYLQIELGQDAEGNPIKQGLSFTLGTLRHLKDVMGGDPFTFSISNDIEGRIRDVTNIIYAALLSNYKSKKKEQDFTLQDVTEWTEGLSIEEAITIANAFSDAYKTDAPGEGSADTQPQAAHVAADA